MDLLSKAQSAMDKGLCDHCLGRLFAQLGHGLTNDERGKALRVYYAMRESGKEPKDVPKESDECSLCGNLFEEIDDFVELILNEIEHIEFNTFLVGSRIDPEIEEREERLWTELDITTSEPIKSEINREVGKRVDGLIKAKVDLKDPHLKAILDTRFNSVEIELAPLFMYGRYKKLSRKIPQTKWICRKCWGTGCEHCGNTGKLYETSVEEIIGEPLKEMVFGEDYTLHGMGREDIDAKMLGNGRPFVMEIKNPLKRHMDLKELKRRVKKDGRVEIDSLKITYRDKVRAIKEAEPDKTYKVKIALKKPVSRGKFKKVLQSLSGVTLRQRTPNRVSHRRSDKVRKRKISEIELKDLDHPLYTLELKAEAGTYIKEFIHGDEGRTEPNLSEELGVQCQVEKLNVIEVHYKDEM